MEEVFDIGCPKCGSTQITANKKGYSAGKAITGAILTGGIGLIAGFHGSNKVTITCLACGNKFKAGQGKKVYRECQITEKNDLSKHSTNSTELNRIICTDCKTENFTNHSYCRNCGRLLTLDDLRINSAEIINIFTCPACKKLTPIEAKFCAHCKAAIIKRDEGADGCIFGLIIAAIVTIIFVLAKSCS